MLSRTNMFDLKHSIQVFEPWGNVLRIGTCFTDAQRRGSMWANSGYCHHGAGGVDLKRCWLAVTRNSSNFDCAYYIVYVTRKGRYDSFRDWLASQSLSSPVSLRFGTSLLVTLTLRPFLLSRLFFWNSRRHKLSVSSILIHVPAVQTSGQVQTCRSAENKTIFGSCDL